MYPLFQKKSVKLFLDQKYPAVSSILEINYDKSFFDMFQKLDKNFKMGYYENTK